MAATAFLPMSERFDDDATIDWFLRAALDRAEPERLRDAMNDAVFPGGARVRPRLCLAVARAASGHVSPLAKASAAAVELIHCASLVHDDLPCFDDADTRRGRPSIHRKYGEAMAVLVGDALIVSSFATLAAAAAPATAVLTLANATGSRGGLVSGQALELDGAVRIDRYHHAKTGGLFEAAARLGAIPAGADPMPYAAFGQSLGRFYQLADDAADQFGDADALGKPTGQDATHRRPTALASVVGRQTAATLLREGSADVLASIPQGRAADELRAFIAPVLEKIVARSLGGR